MARFEKKPEATPARPTVEKQKRSIGRSALKPKLKKEK